MKVLSIDYGKKNIGLAVGDFETLLAEPLKVIRVTTLGTTLGKIGKAIKLHNVDKVVVGVSENEIAKESRIFGKKIKKLCNIEVEYVDETMTSKLAIDKSIEAGIKRKKRKNMEHAYSAALILDNYFQSMSER